MESPSSRLWRSHQTFPPDFGWEVAWVQQVPRPREEIRDRQQCRGSREGAGGHAGLRWKCSGGWPVSFRTNYMNKNNLAEFLFGYRYLFMNGWLIPSFIYAWTDMTKRGLRVQFWKSMSKVLDKQIDFKKSPIAKKYLHNMFIICRTF